MKICPIQAESAQVWRICLEPTQFTGRGLESWNTSVESYVSCSSVIYKENLNFLTNDEGFVSKVRSIKICQTGTPQGYKRTLSLSLSLSLSLFASLSLHIRNYISESNVSSFESFQGRRYLIQIR